MIASHITIVMISVSCMSFLFFLSLSCVVYPRKEPEIERVRRKALAPSFVQTISSMECWVDLTLKIFAVSQKQSGRYLFLHVQWFAQVLTLEMEDTEFSTKAFSVRVKTDYHIVYDIKKQNSLSFKYWMEFIQKNK